MILRTLHWIKDCKFTRSLFLFFHSFLLDLKGPSQPHLFLLTCASLDIIFYSEHVETNEITVKLLNRRSRSRNRIVGVVRKLTT